MNLIFCKLQKYKKRHFSFFFNFKNLKKDELNFSSLKKLRKSGNFIFCKPKKPKNHELHFLQACKRSKKLKNVSLIFCNLQNAQNI